MEMRKNMSGILYGVGVGPGDPELMTLKAVKLIKENTIIALPGKEPEKTMAYQIAAAAVPELSQKELLAIDMPMTPDKREQAKCHQIGAERIEAYLKAGKNVVWLALGDVSIYSTFTYIQRIVEKDGYLCEPVSGVASFCAAAAGLKLPLGIWDEPIHIFPGVHFEGMELPETGTVVFMKPAGKIAGIKKLLRESGREAVMAENCTMEQERIYEGIDEIPDSTGYYSLIISKKESADAPEATRACPTPDNWMEKLEKSGISVSDGLRYSDGDEEFYRSLLKLFAESKKLEDLKEIFLKSNSAGSNTFVTQAHKIKSEARGIGADRLGELFYELELAAKENDAPKIEEIFPAAMDEWQKIADIIRSVL